MFMVGMSQILSAPLSFQAPVGSAIHIQKHVISNRARTRASNADPDPFRFAPRRLHRLDRLVPRRVVLLLGPFTSNYKVLLQSVNRIA